MMRLILCEKDTPETGGRVVASRPLAPYTINGNHVLYIGSRAFCEACKTMGVIEKSGGPRRHRHGGREIALDGDIVACRCATPPRMIATSQQTRRHDDLAGSAA